MLRRYLDSEHVDELHACGLQQRHIINLLLLQLWKYVSRNVGEELFLGDGQFPHACPEGILRHAGSNQQVQQACFLCPLLLSVILVIGEEPIDVAAYEGTDFGSEALGELLDELETVSASRFDVRFFEIVPDVGMWIIFIFILVVGGDGNVWKDEDIKDLLKIAFDKFDLARIVDHVAKVLHRGLDQILALFRRLHLVLLNQRPNGLKGLPFKLDEVFAEFEVVKVEKAYNFASRFYHFLGYCCKLRVILRHDEEAGFHDRRQVLLVEIWQLLLAEY